MTTRDMHDIDRQALEAVLGTNDDTGTHNPPLHSREEKEIKKQKRRARIERQRAARDSKTATDSKIGEREFIRRGLLHKVQCIRTTLNDAEFTARHVAHCQQIIDDQLKELARIQDWMQHGPEIIEASLKRAAELQQEIIGLRNAREVERAKAMIVDLPPELLQLFAAQMSGQTGGAQ